MSFPVTRTVWSSTSGISAEPPLRKSRFSMTRIVIIPCEADAGSSAADLLRRHRISRSTCYGWKQKYGGAGVGCARPLGMESALRLVRQHPTNSRPRSGMTCVSNLRWPLARAIVTDQ